MCGDHPCDCKHDLVVLTEAEDEAGPLAIWGPLSVEMPSVDRKLIRLAAVERALPDILKRGRFSVRHHDQLVGEIQALVTLDANHLPHDPRVLRMVEEVGAVHGGLPTAILPVTEAIADAFPRLRPIIGKSVAFAGGVIYGDNRTSAIVRRDIRQGRLDSFSISGTSFRTRPLEWCGPDGCMMVEEVEEMDGSAITIGSSRGGTGSPFDAKTMNPGAAFVVVQEADYASTTPGTRNATHANPKDVSQPIRARGLEFEDFNACVAWATKEGLKDPEAYCGALKAESQAQMGGGKANPLNQPLQVSAMGTLMAGEKTPQTPTPTSQAAPATTNQPAAASAQTPTASLETIQQTLVDTLRRVEDMEKKNGELMALVQSMKATQTPPTPAAPAAPADKPDTNGPPAPEAQAKAIEAAVAKALEPYKGVLDQAKMAKTPEAPKPAPIAQAKQGRVVPTPEPATPGGTGNSQDELKTLMQAVDAGSPVAVKQLIHKITRKTQ